MMAGVKRRPVLDRYQHILEAMAPAGVVMDVACRHDAQLEVICQLGEHPVPADIAVNEVVLQLDEKVSGAESLCVPPRGRLCSPVPARRHQGCYLAVAAAREGNQPLCMPSEDLWLDARLPALMIEVRVRQQAAEVGVAAGRLAEESKVMLIPHPRPLSRAGERGESNLCAGDGPESPGVGALRELHRAVQAVVVRKRERFVSELEGAEDEFVDVRGAFEEGEVGVGVEFGVGRHMNIIRTLVLGSQASNRIQR
jgi:hypothetical protein